MKISVRFLGFWGMLSLVTATAGAAGDLRLVNATKKGDKEAVRSLLQQHVDVNASQPDGATAISWAAYGDDLETADLLISAGANVNVANEDSSETPLLLACANGSAGMVDRLLKAGANPNAATWAGKTPLMQCARTGSLEAVKALLSRGSDANAKDQREGDTALMWAVAQKHVGIVRLLLEHKADVHTHTSNGFTPLLFAAQQGDADSAQMLLNAGADINEATPDGDTPLLIASASGHEAFSIFLLEHGANPNLADRNGIVPLHYAIMEGLAEVANGISMSGHGNAPYLTRPNMMELAKALLARGANPNARLTAPAKEFETGPGYGKIFIMKQLNIGGGRISPVGAAPFLMAALSFDTALMRMLVAAGADPLLANEENVTPLMAAIGHGRERGGGMAYTPEQESVVLEMVKYTVELGNDVNATETSTGLTPLLCASFYGNSERIIQFLVDKGANLNAKTTAGQTPLDIASNVAPKGKVERNLVPLGYRKGSVDLLVKLGAKPGNTASQPPASTTGQAKK
jgi:ankyrin repeat protein